MDDRISAIVTAAGFGAMTVMCTIIASVTAFLLARLTNVTASICQAVSLSRRRTDLNTARHRPMVRMILPRRGLNNRHPVRSGGSCEALSSGSS